MAVKRCKPEPFLDDVVLCAQMGWTWQQLQEQPAKFVEKLQIYLGVLADERRRERLRAEEEMRRRLEGLR